MKVRKSVPCAPEPAWTASKWTKWAKVAAVACAGIAGWLILDFVFFLGRGYSSYTQFDLSTLRYEQMTQHTIFGIKTDKRECKEYETDLSGVLSKIGRKTGISGKGGRVDHGPTVFYARDEGSFYSPLGILTQDRRVARLLQEERAGALPTLRKLIKRVQEDGGSPEEVVGTVGEILREAYPEERWQGWPDYQAYVRRPVGPGTDGASGPSRNPKPPTPGSEGEGKGHP